MYYYFHEETQHLVFCDNILKTLYFPSEIKMPYYNERVEPSYASFKTFNFCFPISISTFFQLLITIRELPHIDGSQVLTNTKFTLSNIVPSRPGFHISFKLE